MAWQILALVVLCLGIRQVQLFYVREAVHILGTVYKCQYSPPLWSIAPIILKECAVHLMQANATAWVTYIM